MAADSASKRPTGTAGQGQLLNGTGDAPRRPSLALQPFTWAGLQILPVAPAAASQVAVVPPPLPGLHRTAPFRVSEYDQRSRGAVTTLEAAIQQAAAQVDGLLSDPHRSAQLQVDLDLSDLAVPLPPGLSAPGAAAAAVPAPAAEQPAFEAAVAWGPGPHIAADSDATGAGPAGPMAVTEDAAGPGAVAAGLPAAVVRTLLPNLAGDAVRAVREKPEGVGNAVDVGLVQVPNLTYGSLQSPHPTGVAAGSGGEQSGPESAPLAGSALAAANQAPPAPAVCPETELAPAGKAAAVLGTGAGGSGGVQEEPAGRPVKRRRVAPARYRDALPEEALDQSAQAATPGPLGPGEEELGGSDEAAGWAANARAGDRGRGRGARGRGVSGRGGQQQRAQGQAQMQAAAAARRREMETWWGELTAASTKLESLRAALQSQAGAGSGRQGGRQQSVSPSPSPSAPSPPPVSAQGGARGQAGESPPPEAWLEEEVARGERQRQRWLHGVPSGGCAGARGTSTGGGAAPQDGAEIVVGAYGAYGGTASRGGGAEEGAGADQAGGPVPPPAAAVAAAERILQGLGGPAAEQGQRGGRGRRPRQGGQAVAAAEPASEDDRFLDPSLQDEVVIWVAVCGPGQLNVLHEEFLVLGSNLVSELRDRLGCATEDAMREAAAAAHAAAARAGAAAAGLAGASAADAAAEAEIGPGAEEDGGGAGRAGGARGRRGRGRAGRAVGRGRGRGRAAAASDEAAAAPGLLPAQAPAPVAAPGEGDQGVLAQQLDATDAPPVEQLAPGGQQMCPAAGAAAAEGHPSPSGAAAGPSQGDAVASLPLAAADAVSGGDANAAAAAAADGLGGAGTASSPHSPPSPSPPPPPPQQQQQPPLLPPSHGSYLFMEGRFYRDVRHPDAEDYSEPIRALCRAHGVRPTMMRAERYWRPGLAYDDGSQMPPPADMHTTRFRDMTVRLANHPIALFCHRACCEHLVFIRDLRRWHPADPARRSAYPLRLRFRDRAGVPVARRRCGLCEARFAELVTHDDPMAPTNPAIMCRHCFDKLHIGGNGERIAPSVVVQPYNPALDIATQAAWATNVGTWSGPAVGVEAPGPEPGPGPSAARNAQGLG